MQPELVRWGPLVFNGYGTMVALGLVVSDLLNSIPVERAQVIGVRARKASRAA